MGIDDKTIKFLAHELLAKFFVANSFEEKPEREAMQEAWRWLEARYFLVKQRDVKELVSATFEEEMRRG